MRLPDALSYKQRLKLGGDEMTFKPMLAPQEDPQSCAKFFDYLSYPLLASYKLDGIRGVPIEGTVCSRTLKALRSRQVQKKYGRH